MSDQQLLGELMEVEEGEAALGCHTHRYIKPSFLV